MESLTKPVALTQDVSKVLDEIRAGAENALYGAGPDESEELFAKQVVSLIEGAGLPVLQTMHYRWFLRELARLWRTRTGRDLAFHLELCIRKWVGLGLEPRTLQFLVCESYERLKGKFEGQSGNDESRTSARDPNLRESVESVDSPPGPSSAESAKSADVSSESLHSSFDARMCQPMAGPRPPADPATGPLESSNPGILP